MALTHEQIAAIRAKYHITPEAPVAAPSTAAAPAGSVDDAIAALESGTFGQAPAMSPDIPSEPAAQPEHFKAGGAVGAFQDFTHGIVKGAEHSILGLGHVGQMIQHVVGEGLDKATGDKFHFADDATKGPFNPATPQGQKAREMATPTNTAEKVGKTAEQVAEFIAPGAAASKAETVVATATEHLPSVVGGIARILGKGAVQGAAAGATDFVQTGGDAGHAAKTALTAGVTRGVLATIGEGTRAIHLPERLYSRIFKNSKADMLSELTANGIQSMKNSEPELYKQLVASGVIKVGENGAPVVNDTLAEQALDRGLRGSVSDMANQVVRGKLTSEATAQAIAKTHAGTIDVSEPQFESVLREIADEYENVGLGSVSGQAKALADAVKASGGHVSAEDALKIRRFLDAMRVARSYDAPVSKLSLSQGNFKELADVLRQRVNSIPGMNEVMKDYSFYIDALEALAMEAKRTGNNQLVGLINSVFLAHGLATGSAPAVGAGLLRAGLNTASMGTRVGSAIENQGIGPGASALLQSGSAGVQSD